MGCLLSLLILVLAAYAAVQVAGSEIDFRALQAEIQSQARLASESTDQALATAVAEKAAELELPAVAGRASIRRLPGHRIQIVVQYPDTVTFFHRWHWVRNRRIQIDQTY